MSKHDDAVRFLEEACRNWRTVPKLSANDIEDVADALARYKAAAEARIARLTEALAVGVAEMARASGRLDVIGTCDEDRRLAAALMGAWKTTRAALDTKDIAK